MHHVIISKINSDGFNVASSNIIIDNTIFNKEAEENLTENKSA